MRQNGNRFFARLPLKIIGIDRVHDFEPVASEVIMI
jgi:hypothetical protein